MPSEFQHPVSESLVNGLRPFERMRVLSPFLTECKNLIPKSYGLTQFSPTSNPFTGANSVAVSWPFPQMLRGQQDTYLFNQAGLEEVNESNWSKSTVTTYDQASASVVKSIPTGDVWHFADYGASWFACNSACVVFRTGLDALHGATTKVYVQDTVDVQSICRHKGRLVFGGFNTTNIWSNWTSIYNTWATAETAFQTPFKNVGQNYVMWSSIGGGDFPLWLFYPQSGAYTYDLDKTAARILDRARRNEFGWMPMSFQGKVLRVAPLGDHVIVYGEDGVDALTYVGINLDRDIPPTYGRRSILDIGVDGRGAVGVGRRRHVFLDVEGNLRSVDPDLNVQLLGFKEFMSGILGERHQFFESQTEGEFLLNGNSDKFLLTSDNRLCRHTEESTSGFVLDGEFLGVAETQTDLQGLLVSAPFDLDRPGIKQTTAVEVLGELAGIVEVAIDFKKHRGSSFQRTAFYRLNREGWTRLVVAGVEFRVVVRATPYTNLTIDRVEISYRPLERRYRRGPDAPRREQEAT